MLPFAAMRISRHLMLTAYLRTPLRWLLILLITAREASRLMSVVAGARIVCVLLRALC